MHYGTNFPGKQIKRLTAASISIIKRCTQTLHIQALRYVCNQSCRTFHRPGELSNELKVERFAFYQVWITDRTSDDASFTVRYLFDSEVHWPTKFDNHALQLGESCDCSVRQEIFALAFSLAFLNRHTVAFSAMARCLEETTIPNAWFANVCTASVYEYSKSIW